MTSETDSDAVTMRTRFHPNSSLPRILAVWIKPMTQAELAAAAGVSQASVSRHLTDMTATRPKQAHVVEWRKPEAGPGPSMAVYMQGPGRDARCTIKPLTTAQTSRRYQDSLRDTGRWEDRLKKDRQRYHSKRPIPGRDHLTAAFYGAST